SHSRGGIRRAVLAGLRATRRPPEESTGGRGPDRGPEEEARRSHDQRRGRAEDRRGGQREDPPAIRRGPGPCRPPERDARRRDDRNKDQPARNGLFASHPETKERIEKIRQQAGTKTTAVVEGRYKQHIKYEPIPITSIAAVEDGSAGLTGPASSKAGDKSAGK